MHMRVVVMTSEPLKAGEQVFLTGAAPELGGWRPDAVPLTRTDDQRWEAIVAWSSPETVECKITRGGWDTEETDANGQVPPNRVLSPAESDPLVIQVAGWKDRPPKPAGPRITGEYEVWPRVKSKFLEYDRDVIVWFPPGYARHPARRYPVLYMHDGRQVFDPATSTLGQDWQVDEWAQEMILSGELEPFLVVAVDCTDARRDEYSPARKGDDYLRFLLHELKPRIDAAWRTEPDRTYIAGSSMGGLISFYAAWKHPDVFSGAACLSPAFVERYGQECFRMVEADRERLPRIQLFLSCGGAPGLEAELLDGTLRMADRLKRVGFPETRMTVRIESWAEHNEEAWSRMTPHWLRFLFHSPQVKEADPGTRRP